MENNTKYLFFDTEMAVCHKENSIICEFGYVITNNKFEVLSHGNIIINPSIPFMEWDQYARNNILTRKVEDYEKEATFLMVYDDIVNIFKEANIVFGHSLEGDAKAINDECIRYNLKAINYDFYDINKIYMVLFNTNVNESLERLLSIFNIQVEGKLHDAETDAFNTMLVLRAIVERLQKPLETILDSCANIKDEIKDFVVKSHKIKTRKKDCRKPLTYSSGGESTSLGNRFAELFDKLEKELDD